MSPYRYSCRSPPLTNIDRMRRTSVRRCINIVEQPRQIFAEQAELVNAGITRINRTGKVEKLRVRAIGLAERKQSVEPYHPAAGAQRQPARFALYLADKPLNTKSGSRTPEKARCVSERLPVFFEKVACHQARGITAESCLVVCLVQHDLSLSSGCTHSAVQARSLSFPANRISLISKAPRGVAAVPRTSSLPQADLFIQRTALERGSKSVVSEDVVEISAVLAL